MSLNFKEIKAKVLEMEEKRKQDSQKGNQESCVTVLAGEFMDFREDDGTHITKFPIQQWQRNPMGNLQGGFLAAMIDNAAGGAAWFALNCVPAATVDMNINYIRPVRPNCSHIITKARVVSVGRQVVLAECKVYDPDGWEVASATTNLVRLLPPDEKPVIVQNKIEDETFGK